MHRPILAFVLALTCLLAATPAAADVPWPFVLDFSYAGFGESSILLTPDGSGPPLTAARNEIGEVVDASITIMIGTEWGDPIANYPFEDIWLQWDPEPGTVAGCTAYNGFPGGVFLADASTDASGYTSFTQPLAGGGWSVGPVAIYISGAPAMQHVGGNLPPIPIRANSPDLTGDRLVDLSDITLFAQDFGGPYAYRADFNWDGAVNLSDVVVFIEHLGVVCE